MADLEPVHLQEDEATGARFLIYGADNGPQVEVQYEGDALWMSQSQAAALFGVTVATVSRHIANIYEEGELNPEATLTKIETVRTEGERQVARSYRALQPRYDYLPRLQSLFEAGDTIQTLGDRKASAVRY